MLSKFLLLPGKQHLPFSCILTGSGRPLLFTGPGSPYALSEAG